LPGVRMRRWCTDTYLAGDTVNFIDDGGWYACIADVGPSAVTPADEVGAKRERARRTLAGSLVGRWTPTAVAR
jgi:hypothetical protein